MNLSPKIKKILYKSRYRGSKEVDHILMEFARQMIPLLSDHELDDLIDFLDQDDIALFKCIDYLKHTKIENSFVQYLIDIQWLKSKVL